jgi:pimeloyl-ACP methyl ester carboxylesterase
MTAHLCHDVLYSCCVILRSRWSAGLTIAGPIKATCRARLFAVLLSAILLGPAMAEEVKTEHQGLDVLGNLDMAPGKSLKTDGAVILLHDTLSHHRAELMAALQELLHARGVNSLAITLSLGLNARRGMFDCGIEQDHRNEDAREELQTWIGWLKDKGAGSVVLAGHGRGGSQVAYYLARDPDKLVRKAVLIAPLAQTAGSAQSDYDDAFRRPLRPVLAEAERLIAADEASTLMENVAFLTCPQARVTAGAFVNYYGDNPNLYTPTFIPQIKAPTLIAVGDQDPLGQELSEAIRGIPTDISRIGQVTIAGADHQFRDVAADTLVDRIKAFLQQK